MHSATFPLMTPMLQPQRKSPMTLGAVVLAHAALVAALMALRVIPTPVPPQDLVVHLINLSPPIATSVATPAEPLPVKRQPTPNEPRPNQPQPEVAAPVMPLPLAAAPSPVQAVEAPREAPRDVVREPAPAVVAVAAPPNPAAVPTAPRFDADYLDNPAPAYPPLSRKAAEEGKVVLRVYVEPSGLPAKLEVRTSSGYERLDKAAIAAVSRWKFVPAHLGADAVGAWVLVPIVFSLKA